MAHLLPSYVVPSFFSDILLLADRAFIVVKGLDHFTESHIFNYAKQYITPHFITEEHENDNEKN